jgi:hypothetical protein
MPASWVGASVRAKLLGRRRLGSAGAAAIAESGGLVAGLQLLAKSPYGAEVTTDMSVEEAQRKVAANVLWNLRLIAGWLPPGGSALLQPLAAWFEITNIEERLAYMEGGGHPAPYQLGRLGTAWSGASRATTPEAVRAAVASSRWGDPDTSDPEAMVLALRFRWASWVASVASDAAIWAATASALLAARVRFSPSRAALAAPPVARPYGLPAAWRQAADPAQLRSMMPRSIAWVLEGVDGPADLWRAEARWWSHVRREAAEMLVGSRYGATVVVAVVALLAYDAWLARAALGAAARAQPGKGVFDAVV